MLGTLISATALLLAPAAINDEVPNTAEGIFLEAVKHWGSSTTDAAMVTVVYGHDTSARTICVDIDSLAEAIARERGLKLGFDTYHEISREMISSRNRRFTFASPDALSIISYGLDKTDFDKELCSLIRKGIYAYRGDRPARLYVGELH